MGVYAKFYIAYIQVSSNFMEKPEEISPRAFVIEFSVKVEHRLNSIIAHLLEVNPDESKSFGTTSQALSFNSKVNLLLDLKYLNKNEIEKFQIFMEIRNKFAHIYHVDTFEKCFELTKNYNRLKKLFEITKEGESLEEDMYYMFVSLSFDILIKLEEIQKTAIKEKAVKHTHKIFTEEIKDKKEEFKKNNPSKAQAVDDFIAFIKTNLITEVDEKIKKLSSPENQDI